MTMTDSGSVAAVKRELQQALDPGSFKIYLGLLREWFGQRLTKDLLEFEISSLFGDKCLDLHNKLIESILRASAGVVYGSTCVQLSKQNVPDSSSHSTSATPAEEVDSNDQSSSQENSNIYIIPSVPGEEPFIYPPYAKDYPVQPEVTDAVDMMEQDPPPVDCDWLQEAVVTFPANENNVSPPTFENRFPPWFSHDFQRVNRTSYAHNVNIVRNVTHVMHLIKDMIERRPHLKQHFVIPGDEKAPYLTSGCSLYGRLLVKAWDYNIQNVNPAVTENAYNAVKDHLKNVIINILKQRRSFQMRDGKLVHSLGAPHPNPYLRQGFHSYDESYSSDTTKMAEVVMQVPNPFPTIEEKERLSALQVSATHPEKPSRFFSCKGTMMDFLLAIQNNPAMIPNNRTRHRLMDSILRSTKGFSGSQNAQYNTPEEDEDYLQSSPLLPVVSY